MGEFGRLLNGPSRNVEVRSLFTMTDHAGFRFEQTRLEPFFVKGKRHAQHASIVGDRIDDGSQVGWEETPFVGRDRQLAALRSARDEAWAGRGSVVVPAFGCAHRQQRDVDPLGRHGVAEAIDSLGEHHPKVTAASLCASDCRAW